MHTTFYLLPRSLLIASVALAGCAATIKPEGLERATSRAIGRELGNFSIQDRHDEKGGRIDYRVKTSDGANYQCYLVSATGFQKAMSLGQTPDSDAICTQMAKPGSAPPAAAAAPVCNALLKAAGRC